MKRLLPLIAFLFAMIATEAQEFAPQSERKLIFKNGTPIEYYQNDGITVMTFPLLNKMYGKDFSIFIKIQNQTQNSFTFYPSQIDVTFFNNGEKYTAQVIPHDKYMKKVKHRQNAGMLFAAMGENARANQAGYSSSYSTTNVSGNVGNTYGNMNVNNTTQNYNGAASYAAHQNAQRNISTYNNQLVAIRNTINQGYLQTNTINSGQQLIGYVNVKFKKTKTMQIIIPVNGRKYVFSFSK